MEGHPRPNAGLLPRAQPRPLRNPVSPSQYTTFPEVAANNPYSAPEVAHYSAPEIVPAHSMSDEYPTVLGQAFEDKQLAYPEYQSTAQWPLGHELPSEKTEEPATVKKKKTIWIFVAIAILLVVIGAAIGGGVGGTMAARRKAAEEASQPSSTSPGSIMPSPSPTGNGTGNACIAGKGEGNFLGLCSFACQYDYVPAPCTCTARGAKVQPPPSTAQKGYPKVDVPDRCSYLGLCSFAWDRGYTDNLAACGSEPAGAVGCT